MSVPENKSMTMPIPVFRFPVLVDFLAAMQVNLDSAIVPAEPVQVETAILVVLLAGVAAEEATTPGMLVEVEAVDTLPSSSKTNSTNLVPVVRKQLQFTNKLY